MLNIVKYHTTILRAYNATRCILRQQHLFTNVRADIGRCNNISLKQYCSKFLLQEVMNSVAHLTMFQ